MLNDYEIKRVDKEKVHPVTSILKLVCGFLAIYCAILLIPDGIDRVYENRENMSEESLKIRIVANSNTVEDQQIKNDIVDKVAPMITEFATVDHDEVYASIASYVHTHYPQHDVKLNIGDHLTPPKIENFTFYPQNMYNSMVLTIGSGRGDNFWCSIFKNVCERPTEKAEKEEENTEVAEKAEVKFVIWEWFKGLFA